MGEAVYRWGDLERYGIFLLTGESCGIGMRVLCDLSREGVENLELFFGGNLKITEGSNWNGSNNAVASILLPRGILNELAAFLLLKASGGMVVVEQGGIYQVEDGDHPEEFGEAGVIFRVQPGAALDQGIRNRHLMSGRIR